MEKERGQIKFIETDDGFRIEVTGKELKGLFSGCCCGGNKSGGSGSDCCESSDNKK